MTNTRDKQKIKQSKQKQYHTKHDIKDLIVKYTTLVCCPQL
jgi:hypothetical protein